MISELLMDYRKSKELHKTFHTLFSEELKQAENRLFEKMKEVKDTRKEQILQNKIDPKTLAEENEEDERIKEFIRSDKINSKLYTRCEFWLFLDILFAMHYTKAGLYYRKSFSIEKGRNLRKALALVNEDDEPPKPAMDKEKIASLFLQTQVERENVFHEEIKKKKAEVFVNITQQ